LDPPTSRPMRNSLSPEESVTCRYPRVGNASTGAPIDFVASNLRKHSALALFHVSAPPLTL
jgi:hypothetical protein